MESEKQHEFSQKNCSRNFSGAAQVKERPLRVGDSQALCEELSTDVGVWTWMRPPRPRVDHTTESGSWCLKSPGKVGGAPSSRGGRSFLRALLPTQTQRLSCVLGPLGGRRLCWRRAIGLRRGRDVFPGQLKVCQPPDILLAKISPSSLSGVYGWFSKASRLHRADYL